MQTSIPSEYTSPSSSYTQTSITNTSYFPTLFLLVLALAIFAVAIAIPQHSKTGAEQPEYGEVHPKRELRIAVLPKGSDLPPVIMGSPRDVERGYVELVFKLEG